MCGWGVRGESERIRLSSRLPGREDEADAGSEAERKRCGPRGPWIGLPSASAKTKYREEWGVDTSS
jgi:hypothetical protein